MSQNRGKDKAIPSTANPNSTQDNTGERSKPTLRSQKRTQKEETHRYNLERLQKSLDSLDSDITQAPTSITNMENEGTPPAPDAETPGTSLDSNDIATAVNRVDSQIAGSSRQGHQQTVSTTTTEEDAKVYMSRLQTKSQAPKYTKATTIAYKTAKEHLRDGLPDPIAPQDVKEEDVIVWKPTPFHQENDIPGFVTGTVAINYLRILKEVTLKLYRAICKLSIIIDSLHKGESPKGTKLFKGMNLINPAPAPRLEILEIITTAENKVVEVTMKHYNEIIPKLESEFNENWDSMEKVNTEEKTLLILKLVHEKNELYNNHLDELSKNNQPKPLQRNSTDDTDQEGGEKPKPQRKKAPNSMRRRNQQN